MTEKIEKLIERLRAMNPRLRALIGILFIALGLLALVTPLTPGSWLAIIGLELIGVRFIPWREVLRWYRRRRGADSDSTTDPEKSL